MRNLEGPLILFVFYRHRRRGLIRQCSIEALAAAREAAPGLAGADHAQVRRDVPDAGAGHGARGHPRAAPAQAGQPGGVRASLKLLTLAARNGFGSISGRFATR